MSGIRYFQEDNDFFDVDPDDILVSMNGRPCLTSCENPWKLSGYKSDREGGFDNGWLPGYMSNCLLVFLDPDEEGTWYSMNNSHPILNPDVYKVQKELGVKFDVLVSKPIVRRHINETG